MGLRQLLNRRGHTVRSAAEAARVSAATIHNWRRNPGTATAQHLSSLAKVLGVTVDELLRELAKDAKR